MTRAIVVLLGIAIASPALADGPSKEVCIESHSKGQDAREQGKLSLARKLFMSCAQQSCPSLVQGDCARFADDLGRTQPSIGFVARDGNGADLPDTTIYVDDMLVSTRIDGNLFEIDPGKHSVKFVHAGKEQVVTVVVNAGEKGRTIAATFGAAAPPMVTGVQTTAVKGDPKDSVVRPKGAKILMITGSAIAVGGIALGVFGITRVPSGCSISSHECSAPPGDPVFDDASSAMKLVNIGFIAGGVGVVATVAGVVWYFQGSSKKTATEGNERVVSPWLVPGGGGVALSGRL